MVYSFPIDERLWKEYAEIRADSFRAGREGAEATEFYREHRAAMDAGARVAWTERYNSDELSALQHAMNLKLRDEAAFSAEYQNEPLPAFSGGEGELSAEQIAVKVNPLHRGVAALAAQRLTAFIDVHPFPRRSLVAAIRLPLCFAPDVAAFPVSSRLVYQRTTCSG